jgi:ribosome assembly protein 3
MSEVDRENSIFGMAPTQPKKRQRKRKRRAFPQSSSSSSSDPDTSPESVQEPPSPLKTDIQDQSSSSTSSSSSAESESDDNENPVVQRSSINVKKTVPLRPPPSPSPPPVMIPPFMPPSNTPGDDENEERVLRDRFRKFWMNSLADGFKEDLEEIRKVSHTFGSIVYSTFSTIYSPLGTKPGHLTLGITH